MPSHDTLTYNQNFKQHADRLREIAKILAITTSVSDSSTSEPSSSAKGRYPFLHHPRGTRGAHRRDRTGNVAPRHLALVDGGEPHGR